MRAFGFIGDQGSGDQACHRSQFKINRVLLQCPSMNEGEILGTRSQVKFRKNEIVISLQRYEETSHRKPKY
jgi:hypothetical protein